MKRFSLQRLDHGVDGIFGRLTDESGRQIAVTLEHAYPVSTRFLPKIPVGEYTCRRGIHRLESMLETFETFEIEKVPGHSNILIHWGNFNCDSQGCVLVGERIALAGATRMVTRSRATFGTLMGLLKDEPEFILTVES